jgi:hypothetical protein
VIPAMPGDSGARLGFPPPAQRASVPVGTLPVLRRRRLPPASWKWHAPRKPVADSPF